jgi:hypothetical protein
MPAPVISFARVAASGGWREDVLTRWCERRGIHRDERRRRWPRGIRSIAAELNAQADAATATRFATQPASRMSEIVLARFEDNRRLKTSVRRLAWSDMFHPLDTLRRTAQTSRAMWRCHVAGAAASPMKHHRLTIAYSLCVLLWLVDRTTREKLTRRFTPALLAFMRAE